MAVVIRSNKIRLSRQDCASEGDMQRFAGVVHSKVFFGSYVEYGVRVGDLYMKADCDVGTHYVVGEDVFVAVSHSDCLVVRV